MSVQAIVASQPATDLPLTETWGGIVVPALGGVLITAIASLLVVVIQARRSHTAWLRDQRLNFYIDVLAVVDEHQDYVDRSLQLAEQLRRVPEDDDAERRRVRGEFDVLSRRREDAAIPTLSRKADVLTPRAVQRALAATFAELLTPGTLGSFPAEAIASGRNAWAERMNVRRNRLVRAMRRSLATR